MSVAVQVDLSGINLIIDEADNVWSTFVDTNTFMPLQREGELYDLLGQHPLQNSRVRTISLVRLANTAKRVWFIAAFSGFELILYAGLGHNRTYTVVDADVASQATEVHRRRSNAPGEGVR